MGEPARPVGKKCSREGSSASTTRHLRRSARCPPAAIGSADGTAWMALFSQTCWTSQMGLWPTTPPIARHGHKIMDTSSDSPGMNKPGRRHVGTRKTAFTTSAAAPGRQGPSGSNPLNGGLLPLCATTVASRGSGTCSAGSAALTARARQMPELLSLYPTGTGHFWRGRAGDHRPAHPERLRGSSRRCSTRMSFLSPYGNRSLSKFHERNP